MANAVGELCLLLTDVAAKATEVAALPTVSDAAALGATLARMEATLARVDTAVNALSARVDTAVNALSARVDTLSARVDTLSATVTRMDARSAVAYNAACGEGVARPFVPVPNAAGQLPAPPLHAVTTAAQFRNLSAAQVAALATFYSAPAATAATSRKEQLKHALGLAFP
jgi:hypothetical protein